MAWTERVVKPGDEPHTWWVFDRRVTWSHFWWLAVLLIGLALVLLLVIPVSRSSEDSDTTLSCGTALSSTVIVEDDGAAEEASEYVAEECDELRGSRRSRTFAFFVAGLLPIWLGRRDIGRGDVRWEHVAASVCVGISLMLLIGPHESSEEDACGPPLWAEVAESGSDDEDSDVADDACLVERPSRVAWAALWGVAAVPFAMAASRARREDEV